MLLSWGRIDLSRCSLLFTCCQLNGQICARPLLQVQRIAADLSWGWISASYDGTLNSNTHFLVSVVFVVAMNEGSGFREFKGRDGISQKRMPAQINIANERESVVWLLCTIYYESKTYFDIGGHNVPHSCAYVNLSKIDTLIKHICGWEHMPRRDVTCIGLNGHSITSKSNSSALDAPESETAKDWNLRRRVSRKQRSWIGSWCV